MPIEYEYPKTVGDGDRTKTTHPAFAQISASRVTGGTYLYGSDFHHNHFMTISVSRSELNRDLSRDWHYARDEMIEVALSEAQWATFVSSLNQGSGVPCTLQRHDHKMIPQLPETPARIRQFDNELKDRLGAVEDDLDELAREINASKLSQKAKKGLLDTLNLATRNLTPNLTFVADQFGEHMEERTEKAKIEIEAYINSAINRAGVKALNEKAPIQIEEHNE